MRSARSPLLLLLLGVAFALSGTRTPTSRSSKMDCSSPPIYFDRCRLPKERFFYNVTAKKCQMFLDYGCPGSRNTYNSLKKCQQYCSEIDICHLPPEVGPCTAKFQRWFYHPETKDCKTFTYGSCAGNANNFNTRWRCRSICRNRRSP